MRLPLATSLTSRDGTLDKDPLITNGLVEGNKNVSVVRSRPGVTDLGLISAGTARLLACWNGLLSVIGSSLSSLSISASGSSSTIYPLISYQDALFTGLVGVDSYVVLVEWDGATGTTAAYYSNGGTFIPTTIEDGGLYGFSANGYVKYNTFVWVVSNTPETTQVTYIHKTSAVGVPSFTAAYSLVGWDGIAIEASASLIAFVAIDSTNNKTRVYRSTDGTSWSYAEITGFVGQKLLWTGSSWYLYGRVSPGVTLVLYTSSDLITFTQQTTPQRNALAYNGGYFYASRNNDGFSYSTDGINFTDSTEFLARAYRKAGTTLFVEAFDSISGLSTIRSVVGAATTALPVSISASPSVDIFATTTNGSVFAVIYQGDADIQAVALAGNETVTPTSIGTLVSSSTDVLLFAEATGAAQSQQELMFKSSEKLWQYTITGGLVLVTDVDYPGHHTYTASSVTRSGSTATFNTTVTNALESGMSVVVSGATQTEYNGTHTITSIVDGDTFTYTVTGTPTTPATGTITVYGGKTTVPGIVFLDGYFFVMTDKGVIYNSDLGNGTSWNALNFVTAAEEPGAGVALGKSANYLVAFKAWSTEPFYDAGNATGSPISPVKSMSTRVGCASGTSLVDVDDKLIWISQTKDKGRSVHVMQGLQQQTPVATPDVERILGLDDLASVSAYGLRIAGHVLYVLTLHTSAITLVYDLTSGVWYQWTSLTADTPLSVTSMTRNGTTVTVVTNTAHGRSDGDPVLFAGADQSDYNGRFNVAVVSSTSLSFQVDSSQATTATGTITATTYTEGHFAYTKHVYCSGRHLLLHESNGHLYEFTDEVASDALAPIDLHCRTGKVDNGNAGSKRLSLLEVVGHKTPNGLALVRWTDDDYTSWSTYRSVDLEQERSQLRRCGDFSRRAFELRYTGDAKVVLGALELDVKG